MPVLQGITRIARKIQLLPWYKIQQMGETTGQGRGSNVFIDIISLSCQKHRRIRIKTVKMLQWCCLVTCEWNNAALLSICQAEVWLPSPWALPGEKLLPPISASHPCNSQLSTELRFICWKQHRFLCVSRRLPSRMSQLTFDPFPPRQWVR